MSDTYFYDEPVKCGSFGVQYLKIPVEELTMVGDVVVIPIPIKGDYIRNMYMDLGDNLTLDQLEYVELVMSQVVIQRFTGEYIFMRNTLRTPKQMYPLIGNTIHIPCGVLPSVKDFVLRFKIKSQSVMPANIGLHAEYVYRDPVQPLEDKYLIEQVQLQEAYGEKQVSMQLQFRNAVKELFIVIQDTESSGFDFGTVDQLSKARLELNQYIKFDDGPEYFRIIQPMMYHTSAPDSPHFFYTYSFCLDPENNNPTGTINMSRITNKLLTLYFTDSQPKNVRVYALSYNHLVTKDNLGFVAFMV